MNSVSEKRIIPIDPNDFLEGHVYGMSSEICQVNIQVLIIINSRLGMLNANAKVSFDEEGALMATVFAQSETYFLEVVWFVFLIICK